MNLFEKPGDFAAFVKLLAEAVRRFDMRVLAYVLMHNHWHLVLWPRRDGDLSRFMQWLSTTHVRRWREHRGSVGHGHLYQGRFKSFVVQHDGHCLTVIRYVEANALRAAMVERAQDWPWCSLANAPGADGVCVKLSAWPTEAARPRDWARLVNDAVDDATLARLRTSVTRGRPFGTDKWVTRTAARLGILSTIRDPWRPKKPQVSRRRKARRRCL
jgi:putative transposase